jgi:hypothetical protein
MIFQAFSGNDNPADFARSFSTSTRWVKIWQVKISVTAEDLHEDGLGTFQKSAGGLGSHFFLGLWHH